MSNKWALKIWAHGREVPLDGRSHLLAGQGRERRPVDHVIVKSRSLQALARGSLAVALLLVTQCTSAVAQESTPEETVPIIERARQIERALQNPEVAAPGTTLRDIPLPTSELSLENALRRALTQHPDLQRALADIEAQEFGVSLAGSSRYPSFSFSASAGQSGSSGQPGGQEVIRTGIQRAYNLGISLNQQLLDFGRTHQRVKISELELASSRLSYLQLRQGVINDVVQAYFNLLRQAQAIEVEIANVQNALLVVNQARGFIEAGTRAKIELVRAEADLANAKFGLVRAQGGYGRALAALASALGEDELPAELPAPFILRLPEWNVNTVRALARQTRPDLIIASLQVAQAEARVRLAQAEYYPIISANAGYNWNDSIFPPLNTGYNVGVSLSVPLINEPALSSGVGIAEANLKAAAASLHSSELTVVQEATEALYTLREAIGSSESTAEGLRAANENFRLASERYRVGVGNSLEVSEAQRLLVQARSQELQARYDVQTAIGNLLRATGQLDSAALLPPDLLIGPIVDLPPSVLPLDIPEVDPILLDQQPADDEDPSPEWPVPELNIAPDGP